MSKNTEALILIESNTSGTGYILASLANKKGIEVLLLTDGVTQYSFDNFVNIVNTNTSDLNEVITEITRLSKIYLLKGIASTSDYYVEMAALVAKKFNCSHPSLNTIKLCRNKYVFREFLKERGFNTPLYEKIGDINQLTSFLKNDIIDFPLVVKPIMGSGSVGVKMFYDKNQLITHAENLLEKRTNDRNQKVDSSIIVEEFLMGEEYSLELFDGKIIGITKKYKGGLPYFVEIGHDFPYHFDHKTKNKLDVMIFELSKVMDIGWGAFHIEFIKNKKGLNIVEINPRLAGGFIPVLIENSIGVNLIEATLNRILKQEINLDTAKQNFSSIRFIIPKQNGKIKIELNKKLWTGFNSSVQYKLYKSEIDNYEKTHSFKDRIGHVIATNFDKEQAIEDSNTLLKRITTGIEYPESNGTGRIKKGIHKDIRKIIFGKATIESDIDELRLTSKINRAHIIMLLEERILSKDIGVKLLKQILDIENCNFEPLLNQEAPRGLYMQYEGYLIETLGMDLAGSMHIGRSRNDLNATLARIQSRNVIAEILEELIDFASDLRVLSNKYDLTIMPAYTHYQPAVPITYGFYLQGVICSLIDKIDSFFYVLKTLEVCPLGSCAVGGTTIPINTKNTSKYLGFQKSIDNALYGVATRDFWLDLLSAISSTSVLISRVSSDYLLWNTQEFSFFDLSDDITGASSIMPNKRNPFVLENIQGKLGVISASFSGVTTAMHKTPFTNSIAVGTESKMFLNKSIKEFFDALKLIRLFINNATPNVQVMKARASSSHTMATEYANKLFLKHNIPFRDAHHIIGKAVREAEINNTSLDISTELKAFQIQVDLDHVVKDSKYGGGPSKVNILENSKKLNKKLTKRKRKLTKYITRWKEADNGLNLKSNEIITAQ